MPRYIDVDELLRKPPDIHDYYDESGEKDCAHGYTIATIKSAPTLSPDDVRGVVHCKDCKWCHAGYCEKYDDLIPWGCANKPWEDWFCADGKRREAKKEAQDAD